jgi:hypothetical protein
MIHFANGTDAQIGDRVDHDGEPSTVEAILDSTEECAAWGLTERGLMLKSAAFGLVFEPLDGATWESVVFLGRATVAGADETSG